MPIAISAVPGTKPSNVTVAGTRPVVHRWYLGGLASAAAAACTHPLDLLKVSSFSAYHFFYEYTPISAVVNEKHVYCDNINLMTCTVHNGGL